MLDRVGQFFGQDPAREQEYREFERRYREDPQQISDREAARRYREMMQHVEDDDDDDELAQEDERAFGQLAPQERRRLAERYRDATRDERRPYHGWRDDLDLERASEPRELGRLTRRASKEDPDLLEQLVGHDSPLASTAGKLALAGVAAFAAKRFLSR